MEPILTMSMTTKMKLIAVGDGEEEGIAQIQIDFPKSLVMKEQNL